MNAFWQICSFPFHADRNKVPLGSPTASQEPFIPNRRQLLACLTAMFLASPSLPAIAQETPSAGQILRKLQGQPQIVLPPQDRLTIRQLKRRPDLRRAAPSIDIQGINFAFGSAAIPRAERWKVQNIAIAVNTLIDRNPEEVILIEGHTDAVGSRQSNQSLSQARAISLKRDLGRYFGVPGYNLETVGYGEDFLLVPTQEENWRNRRVTIRVVTELIER
jgi:outer membrane protein OmpA-like peptidoglycan-associated protein